MKTLPITTQSDSGNPPRRPRATRWLAAAAVLVCGGASVATSQPPGVTFGLSYSGDGPSFDLDAGADTAAFTLTIERSPEALQYADGSLRILADIVPLDPDQASTVRATLIAANGDVSSATIDVPAGETGTVGTLLSLGDGFRSCLETEACTTTFSVTFQHLGGAPVGATWHALFSMNGETADGPDEVDAPTYNVRVDGGDAFLPTGTLLRDTYSSSNIRLTPEAPSVSFDIAIRHSGDVVSAFNDIRATEILSDGEVDITIERLDGSGVVVSSSDLDSWSNRALLGDILVPCDEVVDPVCNLGDASGLACNSATYFGQVRVTYTLRSGELAFGDITVGGQAEWGADAPLGFSIVGCGPF